MEDNIRIKMNSFFQQLTQLAEGIEQELSESQRSGIVEELRRAKERYDKKEIYALFCGETKAGKSSLINNILGEDICTVDSGVCTNTNTLIRYGEKEIITVYFEKSDDDVEEPVPSVIQRAEIDKFVSEKENKNNKRRVKVIEIELPNKHLQKGLVLIDTPGLGALNPLHTATTFSLAPIADVFFLVSSADSELTEIEVSYIEQLLDCSHCQNAIHVLTNADSGSPEVILEKNIKHLDNIVTKKGIYFQYCKVSNTNYKSYRENKSSNMGGFDNFFNILSGIENNVEMLLAKKQIEIVSPLMQNIESDLNVLLQTIEDPSIAEAKIKDRKEAIKRLEEIKNNEENWKITLNKEIKNLQSNASYRVTSDFDSIRDNISHKLKMDEYLSKPQKLGSVISADFCVKCKQMQDYLNKEILNIYDRLREKSGLKIISESINDVAEKKIGEIKSGEVKIDKLSIYRLPVMTRTALYPTVTVGVGAIIGGIVGSAVAPGPGTVIAAKIGAALASTAAAIIAAIVGGVIGLIKGKERVKESKRNKIKSNIEPQIKSEQDKYKKDITIRINECEETLRIKFREELIKEKKRLNYSITELHAILANNSKKRQEIMSRGKKMEKIKKTINSIFEMLS